MTAPTDTQLEALAVQEDSEATAATARATAIRGWKSSTPTPPTPPAVTGFTDLDLGDAKVWNQTPVFKDDFANLVAPGQSPGSYFVYPKGWQDTSKKGTYDPARISVVDRPDGVRALRQQVTTNGDGSFGGCEVCPASNGQPIYWTDMRYSERVHLFQQDNGHYALLGWPAKDSDWESISGEPDEIETDTNNNPTIGGFVHVIGDSGDAHKVQLTSSVKFYDGFHVITIEQVPSKGSWRRYIDGQLTNVILNAGVAPAAIDKASGVQLIQLASGLKVPGSDPLRQGKQLESNGKAPAKATILDTDWIVVQVLA